MSNFLYKVALNNPRLGLIPNLRHKIMVPQDTTQSSPQYRLPVSIEKETKREIKRLMAQGIIRKSTSNFVSPAFPVLKRNGDIRLVVDFRKLIKITQKISYPIPNMQDLLSTFKGSKIFSSLDLQQGYHQILLDPKSIKFTSFIIANDQYEFVRLPFGLKNAPMEFQRAMNQLFGEMDFVKAYLDDIIIFSSSLEDHSIHVKKVFETIKTHELAINFEKSKFFLTELSYLGHMISQKGIRPDPSRLKHYDELNSPKNVKDLQAIIGLIIWSRCYIPNLSIRLAPITKKLQKDKKFSWNEEDDEIIRSIFKDINNGIIIFHPNFNEFFNCTPMHVIQDVDQF